jgi:4-hydroxy-3-methylbut-2-en-1-yl diphosphate reductase
VKILLAEITGFCFGVKRAIDIVNKSAASRGGIETLGAIVHNQTVLDDMAGHGVRVVDGIDDITGDTVVTGAHGVSPRVNAELAARQIGIVDTTCPFVRRAQETARKLAEQGFFVIVYGEADHPEVQGILGWADGRGVAATDTGFLRKLDPVPRRIGIIAQTTQLPDCFESFIGEVFRYSFGQDSEFCCSDTICHDIRSRIIAAADLARRVDLVFVVGGHNSANTRHLAELSARIIDTYQIASAAEIDPEVVRGHETVGVTAGASTPDSVVAGVVKRLEAIGKSQD